MYSLIQRLERLGLVPGSLTPEMLARPYRITARPALTTIKRVLVHA